MNYLVVDCETTGIHVTDNEILTLYAIKLTKNLEVIDQKYFTFKTERWIERYYDAVQIHGITKEACMQFKDKNESLLELINWIGEKHILVCHSKKQNDKGFFAYDGAMLNWEMLGANLIWEWRKVIFSKVISTHCLAQKLNKSGKLGIAATKKDGGKVARVSLSLNSLCDHFKINLKHHDARSDTEACMQLFKKLIEIDKDITYDFI
jgi:DNA polymerase III epsilon subunit-like protein